MTATGTFHFYFHFLYMDICSIENTQPLYDEDGTIARGRQLIRRAPAARHFAVSFHSSGTFYICYISRSPAVDWIGAFLPSSLPSIRFVSTLCILFHSGSSLASSNRIMIKNLASISSLIDLPE